MDINMDIQKIAPRCPIFGQCGGCDYQDIPYPEELRLKEQMLRDLFRENLGNELLDLIAPIVASPREYHYRNRLDLKLVRTRNRDVFIGFAPRDNGRGVIPIEACAIADRAISDFIPALKKEAESKLTERYRLANLVVRTGDDRRVLWGGIGRRSCRLNEEDYLWTEIRGRKILYSLDTFFQANLSILSLLIECILALEFWSDTEEFFDLYGGVGLFGIALADKVKDRKSTRLNSSHSAKSRMPSSA